jgi:hypothetical protein
MPGKDILSDPIQLRDEYIDRFFHTLNSIDNSLPKLIEFKLDIQKDNMMSLVNEASERLQRYENIYPYVKEISHGQTINPSWLHGIEKVLNWALKKGRGKSTMLSHDIKNAWITYVVLLSCAMIDRDELKKPKSRMQFFLKSDKGKLTSFMGSN